MPKLIAHALVGATVTALVHPSAGGRNLLPLAFGAILAVSPDFDMGIDWVFDLPDVHRGFTHSLVFSFFVWLMLYVLADGEQSGRTSIAFGLAYFSHAALDFLTSTRGGVKLLFPFSNDYYNYGLTGIFELPVGSDLYGIARWALLETVVFLPVFLLVLFIKYKIFR